EVACVPGSLTPSEIVTAWETGATLVKLFPAGSMGPSYIRALRDPLPHIPLLATGGVTVDNAPALIEAGAWGLAIGSELVSSRLVAERQFVELRRRAESF